MPIARNRAELPLSASACIEAIWSDRLTSICAVELVATNSRSWSIPPVEIRTRRMPEEVLAIQFSRLDEAAAGGPHRHGGHEPQGGRPRGQNCAGAGPLSWVFRRRAAPARTIPPDTVRGLDPPSEGTMGVRRGASAKNARECADSRVGDPRGPLKYCRSSAPARSLLGSGGRLPHPR